MFLFLVLYEDLDGLQCLVVYPKSQANNAKILIHGDFIEYAKYEQWDTDYLIKNIPNENHNIQISRMEKILFILNH